jgi:2,4-dienoyl-CoA reductase-like NADH-dependent reductase (Old Yellow Enzyme family)
MSDPFEKFPLGGLELDNRFVLSAAYDSSQPDDLVPIVKGGVGLVISGSVDVTNAQVFENTIRAIHDEGGTIVLQVHTLAAGLFGLSRDPEPLALSELPQDSAFFNPTYRYARHRAATEGELDAIIKSYVRTAAIAKGIGADGVEIHSAANSFLSQALSPITNKRTDRWGGPLENRLRIHEAVIKGMRKELGPDYPLLIKVGLEDAIPGGMLFSEGKEAAERIASYGVDAIEISQGLLDLRRGTPMKGNAKTPEEEGYFKGWGGSLKRAIDVPVIVTGGIRSFEAAQSILDDRQADLIGMCRPLIREPGLIERWRREDRRKSACIDCNHCMKESGLGIVCPFRETGSQS